MFLPSLCQQIYVTNYLFKRAFGVPFNESLLSISAAVSKPQSFAPEVTPSSKGLCLFLGVSKTGPVSTLR